MLGTIIKDYYKIIKRENNRLNYILGLIIFISILIAIKVNNSCLIFQLIKGKNSTIPSVILLFVSPISIIISIRDLATFHIPLKSYLKNIQINLFYLVKVLQVLRAHQVNHHLHLISSQKNLVNLSRRLLSTRTESEVTDQKTKQKIQLNKIKLNKNKKY